MNTPLYALIGIADGLLDSIENASSEDFRARLTDLERQALAIKLLAGLAMNQHDELFDELSQLRRAGTHPGTAAAIEGAS